MSANVPQAQQDIGGVLKRIEGDIHEFVGCIQRAEATVNAEDKESCHKELEALSARLQEHRSEIRRWSAPLDARTKGRLGAARGRIDQELRRFKIVEARLRPKATSNKGSDAIAPSKKAADVSESVALQPVAEEEEAKASPGAVKVLVEQVLNDGSEKSEMREEFLCKICLVHLVGCKPKLTSCSHLFCGDCLEKWFAVQPGSQSWAGRARSAGTVPCPVCKEKLHEERDVYTVGPGGRGGSLLLWQMLSGMPLVCANHPKVNPKGRCDWRGDYGSYEEHIRNCQNAPVFSAATSPTVTPDFTPAACSLDEDLARLRLDSASSEDGFVSEYEEPPHSSSTSPDASPEPKQAAEPPQEGPAEPPKAREPSGRQEELAQKPQSSAPLESGSRAAPTSPAAPAAEAESGEKASQAGQDQPDTPQDDQEVAEQASQPSAAPEPASMSDLKSLISALYELKVQERLRLQQTAGAGAPAQAPARSAAAAAPQDGMAQATWAEEAKAALAAEPEPLAEKKQAAPAAEPKKQKKQQPQAAESSVDVQVAVLHAQMRSAQAARAAQAQAAEWQMAQAAWWQQQQLWQAAQWHAAYSASLGQQPHRR